MGATLLLLCFRRVRMCSRGGQVNFFRQGRICFFGEKAGSFPPPVREKTAFSVRFCGGVLFLSGRPEKDAEKQHRDGEKNGEIIFGEGEFPGILSIIS